MTHTGMVCFVGGVTSVGSDKCSCLLQESELTELKDKLETALQVSDSHRHGLLCG